MNWLIDHWLSFMLFFGGLFFFFYLYCALFYFTRTFLCAELLALPTWFSPDSSSSGWPFSFFLINSWFQSTELKMRDKHIKTDACWHIYLKYLVLTSHLSYSKSNLKVTLCPGEDKQSFDPTCTEKDDDDEGESRGRLSSRLLGDDMFQGNLQGTKGGDAQHWASFFTMLFPPTLFFAWSHICCLVVHFSTRPFSFPKVHIQSLNINVIFVNTLFLLCLAELHCPVCWVCQDSCKMKVTYWIIYLIKLINNDFFNIREKLFRKGVMLKHFFCCLYKLRFEMTSISISNKIKQWPWTFHLFLSFNLNDFPFFNDSLPKMMQHRFDVKQIYSEAFMRQS